MYAAPYRQNAEEERVDLCVTVIKTITHVHFFHVELTGPLIEGTEPKIEAFHQVRIIGRCDNTCHGKHPGGITGVMLVGDSLRAAISSDPRFEEMTA